MLIIQDKEEKKQPDTGFWPWPDPQPERPGDRPGALMPQRGEKGDPGAAASVTVGTVTTLEPGEPATVSNVGTDYDAILNFGIPKGDKGTDADEEELRREISELDVKKEEMEPETTYSIPYRIGKTINSTSGNVGSSQYYALFDTVTGGENTVIINDSDMSDNAQFIVNKYYDGTYIGRKVLAGGAAFTFGDSVNEVKIVFGHPTSSGIVMTREIADEKFRARIINADKKEKPLYVAFGASTAAAAVHHTNDDGGGAITYSYNDFPHYFAKKNGMRCLNMSRGGTGFIARNNGRNPNYMDWLIMNDYSDASMISIAFGYGNDRATGMPIGYWDDYYPYDTDGNVYQSGNIEANTSGITSMIDGGATLFGCLNWSVKWIGEHYPKALLVVILGAPSGNSDRVTTVDTETNKISVTIPTNRVSSEFEIWRKKLNIATVNLYTEGIPFSYYQTFAKDEDGKYSVFSEDTNETSGQAQWNSHPNDAGYEVYARFLAGKIASCGARNDAESESTVTSVNGRTGAVVLSASDVGALPDSTVIPSAYDDTEVRGLISAKYTKPSAGIPKTDLATAVQTSLGKADTALQSLPSHSHAQSDITGLSTALSGKANSSHSHAQSDITGLADALGTKLTDPQDGSVGDVLTLTADGLAWQTPSGGDCNIPIIQSLSFVDVYNDLMDTPHNVAICDSFPDVYYTFDIMGIPTEHDVAEMPQIVNLYDWTTDDVYYIGVVFTAVGHIYYWDADAETPIVMRKFVADEALEGLATLATQIDEDIGL